MSPISVYPSDGHYLVREWWDKGYAVYGYIAKEVGDAPWVVRNLRGEVVARHTTFKQAKEFAREFFKNAGEGMMNTRIITKDEAPMGRGEVVRAIRTMLNDIGGERVGEMCFESKSKQDSARLLFYSERKSHARKFRLWKIDMCLYIEEVA